MKWLSLVGVVPPLLAAVVTALRIRDNLGLARRVRSHARLRREVEGSAEAVAALDVLLGVEARALSDREQYLLRRELDGVRLGLSIFFVLLSLALAVPLTQWIVIAWGSWWVLLAGGVTLGLAVLLIAFTAVGFSQIYSDPDNPKE